MAKRERPLSPFMYYRWQYTNTLSILHRLTGIFLAFGLIALVYWLAALAAGPERYSQAQAVLVVAARQPRAGRVVLEFLLSLPERYPAPVLGCGLRIRAQGSACERLGRIHRCVDTDGGVLDRTRAQDWRRCGMSLQSPLARVLGRGSAKDGVSHWWGQRVSASALLLLTAWFVFALLTLPDLGYAAVFSWVQSPLNAVLLSLLIITLVYHSQLGVQVVIEDYVANKGIKILTMLIVNFVHVLLGALGVFAVLRVAFGGAA